jgi:hypothetical protein
MPDSPTPANRFSMAAPALLFAVTAFGAVLLAVSQFLPLFHTHVAGVRGAVASGSVGASHGYALLPMAALALVLGFGVWRAHSRPALLAIGVLGLAGVVITLAHDLSAAHARGLRLVSGHYAQAANQAGVGFYAETLGAMILLLSCICGFILIGAPSAPRRDSAKRKRTRRSPEFESGT